MIIEAHIKTILWDLDGTLLNSFGIFSDLLSEILPIYGVEVPALEVMSKNFHGSLEESIANSAGLELTDDRVNQMLQDFLRIQNGHYDVVDDHLFKDALALMRRAESAGIKQVIVSNREHIGRLNGSPRSIVERSELKDYVRIVISGDDSVHRKPNPEVIEALLADGTVRPQETLVIGDQYVDGLFARNIGVNAVLVERNGQSIAHLENMGDGWEDHVSIVKSLDEMKLA